MHSPDEAVALPVARSFEGRKCRILSTGDCIRAVSIYVAMIRKLKSGQFRLYSRKKNAETGKRRNLGTFATLEQAKQHEREVQYFKKH
jgi:hypothetical protein